MTTIYLFHCKNCDHYFKNPHLSTVIDPCPECHHHDVRAIAIEDALNHLVFKIKGLTKEVNRLLLLDSDRLNDDNLEEL